MIILLTIIFMVTGCNEAISTGNELGEAETLNSKSSDPVELVLENMTINEKIGQMMMIGIYGYEIDDNILYMLNQYYCGGIILFDRNMDTKSQVKNLIADLQAKSVGENPLFIAIDEEGGRVARMRHDIKVAH